MLNRQHQISLNKCRYVLAIYELHGVSRAAQQLGRSQTAVTKALREVENAMGVELFERSHLGTRPTIYGQTLAKRLGFARAELQKAGKFYRENGGVVTDTDRLPILNMTLSDHRLLAFVRCCEFESIGVAAASLEITPMAIKKSLTDIERTMQTTLFDLSTAGLATPTPVAREIARAIKVAFAELEIALDEVASLNGLTRGIVRIGTVPAVRTVINARTIARFHARFPQIQVRTFDSNIESCELALRNGEIDLIAGPFYAPTGEDLIAIPFMRTTASMLVRQDHSIASEHLLKIADLQSVDWVLPPEYVPMRRAFNEFFQELGLSEISSFVETGSNSTMRSLILEGQFVAVSPDYEFFDDIKSGRIRRLTLHPHLIPAFAKLSWNSHILYRRHSALSAAAKEFVDILQQTADEVVAELA